MTPERLPVYEVLARDLKGFGVDQVFGLMSDDSAAFVTTLDAYGVRFRAARHETAALAMVDGYASATEGVAVGVIGRGPATANALLGAMQNLRSGSRSLLVFADSPVRPPARNAFGPEQKGFAARDVLHAAGFRTFVAGEPASARLALAKAWAAAHEGAVALFLPVDVQNASIDVVGSHPILAPARSPKAAEPRPASVRAAADLLSRARRPLIVAGLGAHLSGAAPALVELADHLGAALATSLKGQGMFRDHSANCGILGSFSHAAGRRVVEQADCVLAFGASLNQRTTSFGDALPKDVPLIQVDTHRASIGRWLHADLALIGDARTVAERLVAAVPARPAADMPLRSPEMLRSLADHRHADEFEATSTPRTMDPRSLALELDRLLPADRNVVYDVGNFLQIAPLIAVKGPDHVKYSFDFASIGLGMGTAIGFACGAPGRPTVLIIGDGGFLMTLGELETVVREEVPLIVILMNDCAYGAELHFLATRGLPVAMSKFPDIDFAPVATAFGFEAHTIRSLDELRELGPLLSRPDGPIFIDCKINGGIAAPFLLETLEQERRHAS